MSNCEKNTPYKLALIQPYFGKFHSYFDLWLLSCRNNPDVDFLLFTDDRTPYDYPENIKVTYTTLSAIKERAQALFDFPISLDKPYKICDYRVAYGEIFQAELADYDFWGYCDTDLIFGRIRKIWPDALIGGYDKISDAGHFTLYKNMPELCTAYRTLPPDGGYDYRRVFTTPQNFAYDEWGAGHGINKILLDHGYTILFKPIRFADIRISTYGLKNTRATYDLEPQRLEESRKHHIVYAYDNGVLCQYALNERDELTVHEEGYVHLQKRPMVKQIPEGAERFLLYPPNRFVPYPDVLDAAYLKTVKEKGIWWHYYRIRYDNLKRKIKAAFTKK